MVQRGTQYCPNRQKKIQIQKGQPLESLVRIPRRIWIWHRYPGPILWSQLPIGCHWQRLTRRQTIPIIAHSHGQISPSHAPDANPKCVIINKAILVIVLHTHTQQCFLVNPSPMEPIPTLWDHNPGQRPLSHRFLISMSLLYRFLISMSLLWIASWLWGRQ